MSAPQADGLSQAEPEEVSALTGFDPSRDDSGNEEIVGIVRKVAHEVTGGNCTFADDDVRLLGALANRAVFAGLYGDLDRSVVGNIHRKYGLGKYTLQKPDASAIEARSDATGTGAAEGESAVAKPDAPMVSQ